MKKSNYNAGEIINASKDEQAWFMRYQNLERAIRECIIEMKMLLYESCPRVV